MLRKDVPPASVTRLLFPERDVDYVHFADAREHPFDPGAVGLSRVNAWWLADASLLAYWDADPASLIWNGAGLDFEPLSEPGGGTECHVAWTDAFAIIAYRGTQPDDWQDLFDIVRVGQVDWDAGTGRVHGGFREAFEQIWPQVAARLMALDPSRRAIWFTGHSLGGALATLSMDRFPFARGAYTVGSPMVGDREFVQAFDARHAGRSFRYVNHRDVVTRVPPTLPFVGEYEHVSQHRYIDGHGTVSNAVPAPMDVAALVPAVQDLLSGVDPDDVGGAPLPDMLVDHTAVRYAVHLWNDYIDHQ
jgi:hypothetical protein